MGEKKVRSPTCLNCIGGSTYPFIQSWPPMSFQSIASVIDHFGVYGPRCSIEGFVIVAVLRQLDTGFLGRPELSWGKMGKLFNLQETTQSCQNVCCTCLQPHGQVLLVLSLQNVKSSSCTWAFNPFLWSALNVAEPTDIVLLLRHYRVWSLLGPCVGLMSRRLQIVQLCLLHRYNRVATFSPLSACLSHRARAVYRHSRSKDTFVCTGSLRLFFVINGAVGARASERM